VVATKCPGTSKCQQNLATGNPAACCSPQTFLCFPVKRINMWAGKNEIQLLEHMKYFYTVELLITFMEENENIP